MAWPEWLAFDPIAAAPLVFAPTLIVTSEDAAIPDGARAFCAGLPGQARLAWHTGTQFDFYDDEEVVERALDEVAAHFEATLAASVQI